MVLKIKTIGLFFFFFFWHRYTTLTTRALGRDVWVMLILREITVRSNYGMTIFTLLIRDFKFNILSTCV